jgi:hypothetical protein
VITPLIHTLVGGTLLKNDNHVIKAIHEGSASTKQCMHQLDNVTRVLPLNSKHVFDIAPKLDLS